MTDCDIPGRNRTDIRLAGSTDAGSGRVEILVGDQWGTICDVFWGLADAEVVCRDLGYTGALQATGGACKFPCMHVNHQLVFAFVILDFGQGMGPIHRTQVLCQGFEPNLFTCPSQLETSSCDHSMDAGVICLSMFLFCLVIIIIMYLYSCNSGNY